MQEIIAKIREILSSFQQQYRSVTTPSMKRIKSEEHLAISGKEKRKLIMNAIIPASYDPKFEQFLEKLSESFA